MNDMTRIKNTTFISSYEKLASDDYCDRMIEAWEKIYSESSLRVSGLDGSIQNGGVGNRKDFALFFDEERNKVKELQQETNKILDEGLKKYCAEYPSLDMLQYYSARIA